MIKLILGIDKSYF